VCVCVCVSRGTRPFSAIICTGVCKVLIPMPCKTRRNILYFGGGSKEHEEVVYRVAGIYWPCTN